MYAVIEDSGTQFKVGKGDIIRVDLRDLAEDQTEIEFDKVMLVSGDTPKIGTPYVDGAKVKAEVLTEVRGSKITIIKYKRRKGYRRKRGHRQSFLRIRVTDIAA
ncbi:50S ribosomal protein L21 [Planctomycetales bacterium ZRK34]|nr:50S ribosomal protein L21 [Planctomycetales bacterium ZRK34]